MTSIPSLMIIFIFLLLVGLAVFIFIEIIKQIKRVLTGHTVFEGKNGVTSSEPVRPLWLRILKIIFLLCVFGILVIFIVSMFWTPKISYQRARLVATIANLKNLETGVVCYLMHPDSNGRLPVTESKENTVLLWNGFDVSAAGDPDRYTVEQILLSYGFLERYPKWRIGNDAEEFIDFSKEPVFNKEHQAFYMKGSNVIATSAPQGSNWSNYNRTEISPVTDLTGVEPSDHFPIAFKNGRIDRVNFYLDGRTSLEKGYCAYVVLKNVSLKDARELSLEINGELDNTATKDHQYHGRLIFDKPNLPDGVTDVYYFINHVK